jgi:tetratricopeptide (TPR) repeat protein
MAELNLRFPDKDHVIVSFDGEESGALHLPFRFLDPLTAKERQDLRWYVEVYGAHSLGDPDDADARRIALLLPDLGKRLFGAVFNDPAARRLFCAFQDSDAAARLLTVSAESPSVLGLPWELLHDPSRGGVYLFDEHPRISIRRRVTGAKGGRAAFKVEPRDRLHLLFVISRPEESGFLDPRADASAVLDALEAHAPGRFTCEFLRPPTLDALTERLDDKTRPPVDILHFDGHGVFDTRGGLPERLEDRTFSLAQVLSGQWLKDKHAEAPVKSPANTGYLLFEKADGKPHLVSGEALGLNLNRRCVPLVILAACQSATQGDNGEPMGSVAARLTAAGIPAVLAMPYSVLVPTTRALFGQFYEHLARHESIGESLDASRHYLHNHPAKYQVQRGPDRVPLMLYDWFVPALYQSGADVPLIREAKGKKAKPAAVPAAPLTNVPPLSEAGFFGRKRELWDVERWFADRARRITLTGFGGQGKTALALEAARWLTRAGMFRATVFVDYSGGQAADAVGLAVRTIGGVLNQTLLDAPAAAEALKQTPTLVILDNLEALAPEPLRELLDAAKGWSEAGPSRVLLTTRTPDFNHPDYRVAGTLIHRRIVLAGLGSAQAPDDALEWFAALSKLPPPPEVDAPRRESLIALFDKVRFHPLSIRVLSAQLKTRRPADLGRRLEQLLAPASGGSPSPPSTEALLPELVASLTLSLDRLDAAARQVLPRLGVFQGGAFEDDLLAITGLGDHNQARREQLRSLLHGLERRDPRTILQLAGLDLPDGVDVPPEVLGQIPDSAILETASKIREDLARLPAPPAEANIWPDLRRQLEAAALVEAERVPGVGPPFLRFHPTLAPMLWGQLGPDERARLTDTYRQRYAALARYLYQQDTKIPHEARAIVRRELPNLLHAVDAAFDAHDPDAVVFAESVIRFLHVFGLRREADRLTTRAQAASGDEGSRSWYLAQTRRGESLLGAGQAATAARVFETILARLGATPSYERAVTLAHLGRCFEAGGRPDLAAACYRDGIAVTEKLDQAEGVKRVRSGLHSDLGDVLSDMGAFADARAAYEMSLGIMKELGGDLRGEGVGLGQLGYLALREGKLDEALARYQAALALFQKLREPAMEATAWHQLGMVFQEARQWDEAERHYREAARLKEESGLITGPVGAANSWNQLAQVFRAAGKSEAAERWYRKAMEAFRGTGDLLNVSRTLYNLAVLLHTQPGRIDEARQLAEEALALKKNLDPAAAEIWKTYEVLANIADAEAASTEDDRRQAELQAQVRYYRRLAREAKRNYAGTRHEVRRHLPLILAVVKAAQDPAELGRLEAILKALAERGWANLVNAARRIVNGEREADNLAENLDLEDSMIVETILAALSDPSTLSDLLPPEPPGAEG